MRSIAAGSWFALSPRSRGADAGIRATKTTTIKTT
jgi:hypothetical protein